MSLEFDFNECLNALDRLTKRVANQNIDIVLREGAKPMLEGMRVVVPKGDTGNLERSLGIGNIYTRKGNRQIHIGIINAQEREVVYGYYQHYGTRRMIGKYWINEAYKLNKDRSKEIIKKKLVELIKG